MFKKRYNTRFCLPVGHFIKTGLMWLNTTLAFLLIGLLQIRAEVHAQQVTIHQHQITLDDAFAEINRQTGYQFLWMPTHLKSDRKVDVQLNEADLNEALDQLLKKLPLDYVVDGKIILIKERIKATPRKSLPADNDVSRPLVITYSEIQGKVVDTLGQPLAGASVRVKGYKLSTMTASNGTFKLENVPQNAVLECSYMGYISREVPVQAQVYVVLKPSESPLDVVQVIAYGTTSKRYTTSSVTTVTAEEIEKQPISNVLQALAGKVPGLKSIQQDGLPGGWFDLNIRGTNSLSSGTRPLILIDGIPFSNESTTNRFPGTNSYDSPLNVLNTFDIQSVDVLKDADATAIYGSRGSNGVILITTKKGRAGKPQLKAEAYAGVTTATRFMQLLNTQQYLEMRREAYKNDGVEPTVTDAPDLLLWDTTKYTDWNKEYRTGNGTSKNLQLDYSGGSEKYQFRVAYGYHRETPLYGDVRERITGKNTAYDKHSVQLSFSNQSLQDKLRVNVNVGYNFDFSNFASSGGMIILPPNAPDPIDKNGELYWLGQGIGQTNPIAPLYESYDAQNKLLNATTTISYEILKGLQVKVNGGYNTLDHDDIRSVPAKAKMSSEATGNSNFTYNTVSSWQVEPIVEYKKQIDQGELDVLAGGSWHRSFSEPKTITASDYQDEDYVGTLFGANSVTVGGSKIDYTYQGIYGRLAYNWQKKWLLNLTARRDGSSRFGPDSRYSNFGALGMAYIFSEEKWLKRTIPALSFGKFRSNYGITGNDNIGNFMFEDLWTNYGSGYSYDGSAIVYPIILYNPELRWEKNKKLELATDLGFFNDRLLLTANYYRSLATDQLIGYTLPSQTGFDQIAKNFEATVLNYGWEFELGGNPIRTRSVNWRIDANMSIARNKLKSFPGMESTYYASQYIIGKPITGTYFYPYLGVDPNTGLYSYPGTSLADRNLFLDYYGTPTLYGGITNTLTVKGITLEVFCQYSKQNRQSYLSSLTYYPGYMVNQPAVVMDRWRQPGDVSEIQKFTAGFNPDATQAFNLRKSSVGDLEDASFLRIKNVSLSYELPKSWLKKSGISSARIYFEGQNIGVITGYKGMDPESAGLGNPLNRVFTGGLSLTL
ncbi:TonB-linked outer membrane protein, SusC/RagA family [bacterium A37T11]|nr:TonB-linked outer membrane protein, SusC/RagA family [bacterium A37T11]